MQNPVPVFTHFLTALSRLLDKAEAHAEAKRLKPEVIPNLRLIADMLPFWRQVTIACDHAKGACARLAGLEVPSFADTETTLADLRERVAKTQAFLSSIPADAFTGAEARTIHIKAGPRELTFTGDHYQNGYAVPNFFFHMTTAYNILRANGVDVGKVDFLGG
ncbi:DUF1993 domain-containing protein [Rhodobacter ferrooxidans]|uniref:DUF1993 domain-containing protein n=1 Tax=Rhodobacter ferrooxidans TaxID=371731 RepID=C8RZS4_9RHOB|nr:DUF1993 domain-containing protein [Rhodobacter sp. SW2]EEW25871.1 conserved hypothetical protein [Rhodobacter sp. SW2]